MHENEQDAREGSWGLCCLRMCLDFPPAGKQNLTEHRTQPRPHAQPQADPDRTAQGRARTGRSFCALVMPPPCFGLEPRAGRHVYKNKDRKEKGKRRLLLLPQRREENEQGAWVWVWGVLNCSWHTTPPGCCSDPASPIRPWTKSRKKGAWPGGSGSRLSPPFRQLTTCSFICSKTAFRRRRPTIQRSRRHAGARLSG